MCFADFFFFYCQGVYLERNKCLETELGEEPLVVAVVDTSLEESVGLADSHTLLGGVSDIVGDLANGVHAVSGRHAVGVVNDLDKANNLGAVLALLLAHGLGDLEGALFDTSNDAVTVLTLLGALSELLKDDSLLAGKTARGEDNNLSGL